VNPIGELWSLLGNLTPERRRLVKKEYAQARKTVGDGEASARVLVMLTDAERTHAALDQLTKPSTHVSGPPAKPPRRRQRPGLQPERPGLARAASDIERAVNKPLDEASDSDTA
jgi:hypothetical protein